MIMAIALRRNKTGATQKKSDPNRIISKLQDKNDFGLVQKRSIEGDR